MWLTCTKRHYRTVYACGKVVAECPCPPVTRKAIWELIHMCPDCEAAVRTDLRESRGKSDLRTHALKGYLHIP